MPPHAGFAAAIAIGQEVFQGVVRVLHKAGALTHTLAVPAIPISGAFGGGTLTLNLFLDVPTVTFVDGTGDLLTLDLTAWGPMSLQQANGSVLDRMARVNVRVFVRPTFALRPDLQQLRLRLDGMGARVDAFDVQTDSPLPPATQAYLASGEFGALVELAVRTILGSIQDSIPPFPVSFLGPIATQPTARVDATRVLNGAIALGLNAELDGQPTVGDSGALVDFRDGEDIATYLNPALVPVTFAGVRDSILQGVADAGSHLDRPVSMTLAEGHLHVAAEASSWQGSQSFSFNVFPFFDRITHILDEWDEEYGEHFVVSDVEPEQLLFGVRDIQVDTEPVWWVRLIEALTGIAVFIVERMAAMKTFATYDEIGGSGGGGRAVRNQSYTIAGTPYRVDVRLDRFQCHTDGIFIGISFKPPGLGPWPPTPETRITSSSMNVDDLLFREPMFVDYRAEPPFDAHPDDPFLRIRWTLRRLDRNEVVSSVEGPYAANAEFEVDYSAGDLVESSAFSVEMRIYRQFAGAATELASGLETVRVSDRLDRSHPYVHWKHSVMVPIVSVGPNDERTVLRQDLIERRSKIHRTHVPGRCRMASRFAAELSGAAASASQHVDYLDTLPFPVSALPARRGEVCDYCFFGGPSKTVPLPLP